VRVHVFRERGPPGSNFASMVDRLGSDGPITGVSMPARKQPYAGLWPQPAAVSFDFVKQLWAEQHIAVLCAGKSYVLWTQTESTETSLWE
jgi:hypothetical protein